MRNIIQLETQNQILREISCELTKDEILSTEIQSLIEEMKETMRNAPGVGLAAPQIGIGLQLAVIEDPKDRLQEIPEHILSDRNRKPIEFHAIINPKIIELSGKTNYFFESCLSIKNRARVTPRKDKIKIKCFDEHANEKTIVATGWYARILQHEIDHLNGSLYIDIADAKSEIEMNDENKAKWSIATRTDILEFYKNKCPDKIIE